MALESSWWRHNRIVCRCQCLCLCHCLPSHILIYLFFLFHFHFQFTYRNVDVYIGYFPFKFPSADYSWETETLIISLEFAMPSMTINLWWIFSCCFLFSIYSLFFIFLLFSIEFHCLFMSVCDSCWLFLTQIIVSTDKKSKLHNPEGQDEELIFFSPSSFLHLVEISISRPIATL